MLTTYAGVVDFFTPDVCMADAQKYLPLLFEKRSLPAKPALTLLSILEYLLHIVDENVYKSLAEDARLRIKNRDIRDWPIVATALTLNCPIWTEDQDFLDQGSQHGQQIEFIFILKRLLLDKLEEPMGSADYKPIHNFCLYIS